MLTVRRLNMDTSWQITWNKTSLVLDPWLVGSEIDGFSWFNEQWHATPPLPIDRMESYDGLLVSQSYSDHCHKETILQLEDRPVLCTPTAFKRLAKEVPGASFLPLPNFEDGKSLSFQDLKVSYLDPGRKVDPIYYGIVISSGNEAVVYAPHGFSITETQMERLEGMDILLLITSFSLFRLPFFLGGAVNPGMKPAKELVSRLNPVHVMHTHDENKHAQGIVKKIAKIEYPSPETLQQSFDGQFVYLDEQYKPYEIKTATAS